MQTWLAVSVIVSSLSIQGQIVPADANIHGAMDVSTGYRLDKSYGNVGLVTNGKVFCGGALLTQAFVITSRRCAEYPIDHIETQTTAINPLNVGKNAVRPLAVHLNGQADLALIQTTPVPNPKELSRLASESDNPASLGPYDPRHGGVDIWLDADKGGTVSLWAYPAPINTVVDATDMYGGAAFQLWSNRETKIPCYGSYGNAHRNFRGEILGVISLGNCGDGDYTRLTATRIDPHRAWIKSVSGIGMMKSGPLISEDSLL